LDKTKIEVLQDIHQVEMRHKDLIKQMLIKVDIEPQIGEHMEELKHIDQHIVKKILT